MATSNSQFNDQTEALEVAAAFARGIQGKTVLITGVNQGGIGFSTAEAFASQHPAHLIIAGRNLSKIEDSINALKSRFPEVDYRPLQINLSSQQSVRTAAAELLSWTDVPIVNIILNSAGIMCLPERTLSEDGIEMHFATNHIGHFLFTSLIMPKLIKAAEGAPKGATRVVNVTSASPMVSKIRWSDMKFEKLNKDLPTAEQPSYDMHRMWGYADPENMSYVPLEGYNNSKVANVLFGIGANQRLYDKHGVLTLAVHPGIIQTELGRNMTQETLDAIAGFAASGAISYKTLGAGASTSLVAALDPKLAVGETKDGSENYGAYLVDCQISDKGHPLAVSSDEAEKLWKLSEELVKETFVW
ncbi:putative short-chain dehydrogenase [Thelonectria olida]|uniref:Short-chain dehydrogenase n=1 Tax=Thelonectria olida TaxID=1576542 RepID=A0A9P9AKE8_9HYPO|nr:putative short-chain dehydrogenase [Thelonectria olida]